jgi:predicted flap endonuclease-1-like 5' DNA nuclease
MPYHLDAENINLDDLQKRIKATDLVPSRASLLEKIETKMKALKQQGITTLADLRNELKTSKRLEGLAKSTGIGTQYLALLRREIEGWFPKPSLLKDFDWLPKSEIAKFERNGIRDAAALYEATDSKSKRTALAKSAGVDIATLETFAQLVDLTRVQWVSPTAARMLAEAGWKSAAELARADADELYEALARVNAGNRFFKGKIGLRDVKRLVHAAQYIEKKK